MAGYNAVGATSGAQTQIDAGLRAHMNKIYGTMSVGLLLTALAAWALAGLSVTDSPTQYMIGDGEYLTGLGYALYASPLKYLIMFAPLVMVFGFGAVLGRLSSAGAQTYFYVFSTVMGLSLSSIFLVYTGMSIAQTFLITSIAFASLSLWGYTTKKDITGWGSFLIMGVVGLILASLVNIFLHSPAIDFAVSAIGVLLFAGLTAYDTQKLKVDYIQHAHAMDSEWLGKSAIMGALNLYLDFINLFLFLLRFLGNRD
ncbi:MAG: Bax inhibitor-1/YccA family protein [Maritimibacter sp.]